MRDGKLVRWLCLGLLTVGLSGCALSAAETDSYTARERHTAISRLLIISNVWPLASQGPSSAMQMATIETALKDAFSKCGVVASVLPPDQRLQGGGDEQAIRAFSPDALFVLETQTFETGRTEAGGAYLARIIDMTRKKMVWRAQTSITAGKSREEVFAASIIDRLKADSILCSS